MKLLIAGLTIILSTTASAGYKKRVISCDILTSIESPNIKKQRIAKNTLYIEITNNHSRVQNLRTSEGTNEPIVDSHIANPAMPIVSVFNDSKITFEPFYYHYENEAVFEIWVNISKKMFLKNIENSKISDLVPTLTLNDIGSIPKLSTRLNSHQYFSDDNKEVFIPLLNEKRLISVSMKLICNTHNGEFRYIEHLIDNDRSYNEAMNEYRNGRRD